MSNEGRTSCGSKGGIGEPMNRPLVLRDSVNAGVGGLLMFLVGRPQIQSLNPISPQFPCKAFNPKPPGPVILLERPKP